MTLRAIRARRGFTLIELLTVTGIAIVLATLVVTAVFTAQQAARNATCRSNLAQTHKLIMIYSQSYGQFLPAFWHERWVGELGLSGIQWREGFAAEMAKPHIKYMWDQWRLFLATPGAKTYMPPTGNARWESIRKKLGEIYNPRGYPLGTTPIEPGYTNIDDVNPLMPAVWNNYQPPGHYLGYTWTNDTDANRGSYGDGARTPERSGAPVTMCPNDESGYRCDQGSLVSYMGLAKYGWWHRNDCPGLSRIYEYHQIQEVTNPARGILLAESEPGTWQFGGCG